MRVTTPITVTSASSSLPDQNHLLSLIRGRKSPAFFCVRSPPFIATVLFATHSGRPNNRLVVLRGGGCLLGPLRAHELLERITRQRRAEQVALVGVAAQVLQKLELSVS